MRSRDAAGSYAMRGWRQQHQLACWEGQLSGRRCDWRISLARRRTLAKSAGRALCAALPRGQAPFGAWQEDGFDGLVIASGSRLANSSMPVGRLFLLCGQYKSAINPVQPAREQEEEVSSQEEDEDEGIQFFGLIEEVRETEASTGQEDKT
uniref:Uncharacterized protein n=1 Tax=Sphaerodactylus townsendi TaxID=933632 RepID=A0ACB8G3B9_9SAUR